TLTAPSTVPPRHSRRRRFVLPHPTAGAAALIDPRPFLSLFPTGSGSSRGGAGNIRPVAMGTPRERMGAERHKIRVAEWLYRWNLSMGILGIVFTILTFLGVFTIVLGPLFTQQFGFTFLDTGLVLLVT